VGVNNAGDAAYVWIGGDAQARQYGFRAFEKVGVSVRCDEGVEIGRNVERYARTERVQQAEVLVQPHRVVVSHVQYRAFPQRRRREPFYEKFRASAGGVYGKLDVRPYQLDMKAMMAPFQRIGKLATQRIESIAQTAERRLDATTERTMDAVETAPGAGKPRPQQSHQPASGMTLAGGGLAIAALGSSLVFVAKTISSLGLFKLLLGIAGALAAVALPLSILAVMKLQSRDLSALLEASGWAINARMRLSRAQRAHFTSRPHYPTGARGVRSHYMALVLAAIALALTIVAIVRISGL